MNVIELRFIFIIMFVTVANFNEHQSVYIQRKTVLNHGAFAEMCDVCRTRSSDDRVCLCSDQENRCGFRISVSVVSSVSPGLKQH